MTSTLLVLLLLVQAEGPDNPPDGAMEPPLSASSVGRWRYLTRLEVTGFALLLGGGTGGMERYAQLTPMLVLDGGTLLFPRGQGALRPGAFASVGLGVDHAR